MLVNSSMVNRPDIVYGYYVKTSYVASNYIAYFIGLFCFTIDYILNHYSLFLSEFVKFFFFL
jgi:hypothetical protein